MRVGTALACDVGCGTVFSLSVGLEPFVSFVRGTAEVGKIIEILGQGFTGTTWSRSTGPRNLHGEKRHYLAATVPAGATSGPVKVATPSGPLTRNTAFRVRPQIFSFTPTSGAVGTPVTITGVSLTQTTGVGFGGVPATSFAVNSDTQARPRCPPGH